MRRVPHSPNDRADLNVSAEDLRREHGAMLAAQRPVAGGRRRGGVGGRVRGDRLDGAVSRRRCGAWRRSSHEGRPVLRTSEQMEGPSSDVPSSELFDAVTAEVGGLLGGDLARMVR
jgi:hypothetical protein